MKPFIKYYLKSEPANLDLVITKKEALIKARQVKKELEQYVPKGKLASLKELADRFYKAGLEYKNEQICINSITCSNNEDFKIKSKIIESNENFIKWVN